MSIDPLVQRQQRRATGQAAHVLKPCSYVLAAEDFVRLWQRASCIAEVEAVEGPRASQRAYAYRKRGIPLKRFQPASPGRIDVAGLSAIALAAAKDVP